MASHTPTRILNAARSCYQRVGILKVSMEDIAAEAEISRRTLVTIQHPSYKSGIF